MSPIREAGGAAALVAGEAAHHREHGFANPSGAKVTDPFEFLIDRTRLGFTGPAAAALSPNEAAAGEADAVQWLGDSSLRLGGVVLVTGGSISPATAATAHISPISVMAAAAPIWR